MYSSIKTFAIIITGLFTIASYANHQYQCGEYLLLQSAHKNAFIFKRATNELGKGDYVLVYDDASFSESNGHIKIVGEDKRKINWSEVDGCFKQVKDYINFKIDITGENIHSTLIFQEKFKQDPETYDQPPSLCGPFPFSLALKTNYTCLKIE